MAAEIYSFFQRGNQPNVSISDQRRTKSEISLGPRPWSFEHRPFRLISFSASPFDAPLARLHFLTGPSSAILVLTFTSRVWISATEFQEMWMNIRNFIVEHAAKILFGKVSEVPFDNTYPWLNYTFNELMKDAKAQQRLPFVWSVIQAAALAKVLKIPKISVIEFGVAGGVGLLILERISELVELRTDVGIAVYGFDTGHGLPKPQDWRDHPNVWCEGHFPMKREVLESRLKRASLRLGLVRDTVSSFLAEKPAPIGFVSIDLDLYSSTRDALTVFKAAYEQLLPRVICHFDDIMGLTFNDFAGERLAITEFNEGNTARKLSPIYGLRYKVHRRYKHWEGWESLYFAHLFEHPMYNVQDRCILPSTALPIDSD